VIAVPVPSPGAPLRTDAWIDLADMPTHDVDEIRNFLVRYSSKEGHTIEERGEVGAEGAMANIKRCLKQYRKKAA
jgi:inorganic pyrophosphatase